MRPHTHIAILFICALTMLSAPASARIRDESEDILQNGDVLGNFTRSIQTTYVTLDGCKHYDMPDIQGYLAMIDQYMATLYPNGTPYWVNLALHNPPRSKDECLQVIVQHLIIYQKASKDYAYNYPDEPPPPPLASRSLARWNEQNDSRPSLHLVSPNLVYVP